MTKTSSKKALRAAYTTTYDPDAYATPQDEENSLTEQAHKDACDINNIMKRYDATGSIGNIPQYTPVYGDFTSGIDFVENMTVVANAKSSFEELPAIVRETFGNNPARFLDFIDSEPSFEELQHLGLVDHPIVEQKKSDLGQPKEETKSAPKTDDQEVSSDESA